MTTLAVAENNTTLDLAYIRVAATPDLGGVGAHSVAGTPSTAEIALLAEPIDVNRAPQLGLVNRMAPRGVLEETVRKMATRIALAPSFTVKQTMSLIASAASERDWPANSQEG